MSRPPPPGQYPPPPPGQTYPQVRIKCIITIIIIFCEFLLLMQCWYPAGVLSQTIWI